mgnify:CR=1 FL=1
MSKFLNSLYNSENGFYLSCKGSKYMLHSKKFSWSWLAYFDICLTFVWLSSFLKEERFLGYDSICSFLSAQKKFVFKNFLDTESF